MNVSPTRTFSKVNRSWFRQHPLFNTGCTRKTNNNNNIKLYYQIKKLNLYLPFFIAGTEWCIRMIPCVVTLLFFPLSSMISTSPKLCQSVNCEPAFYLCLSQLYNSPVYRCHMLDWLSSGWWKQTTFWHNLWTAIFFSKNLTKETMQY